ncbi:hypothetical protein SERLADRAFT_440563 [Serpula lacrymans var. lacrymans S7.9]|uniref:Uncharacterized protein n=1 Tax=Serpula lacrymans var. lacrymans (strain S7.9) TaxID=578457 RepID=F8P313_SERL9|nr:uncharacterized protein SERLADRAFT_440563 [Serpula lacrymans var. lacrymans S7.9]EGO22544.1 hypothetical protein SERLADRAFT_440563 [Serpula lacrymans var. lacrymans S7.9]
MKRENSVIVISDTESESPVPAPGGGNQGSQKNPPSRTYHRNYYSSRSSSRNNAASVILGNSKAHAELEDEASQGGGISIKKEPEPDVIVSDRAEVGGQHSSYQPEDESVRKSWKDPDSKSQSPESEYDLQSHPIEDHGSQYPWLVPSSGLTKKSSPDKPFPNPSDEEIIFTLHHSKGLQPRIVKKRQVGEIGDKNVEPTKQDASAQVDLPSNEVVPVPITPRKARRFVISQLEITPSKTTQKMRQGTGSPGISERLDRIENRAQDISEALKGVTCAIDGQTSALENIFRECLNK